MASVLVVDDAAFMRMRIKQMLEASGHTMVGEAMDGVEAIEKFAELNPDVVILDITMPGMDGIEALKRIKVLNKDAQIIICSAMGYQELIAKAIEQGAKEFIVKPFKEEQLMAAIDKVVGK